MRQKLGFRCSPLFISNKFKTAENMLHIGTFHDLQDTWLSSLNHKPKVTYVHLPHTARSLWATCDREVQQFTRWKRAKPSVKTATHAAAGDTKKDTRGMSLHCELWQPWGGGGGHMLTVDWYLHDRGSLVWRLVGSIAGALYTYGWQLSFNLQTTSTNKMARRNHSNVTSLIKPWSFWVEFGTHQAPYWLR